MMKYIFLVVAFVLAIALLTQGNSFNNKGAVISGWVFLAVAILGVIAVVMMR